MELNVKKYNFKSVFYVFCVFTTIREHAINPSKPRNTLLDGVEGDLMNYCAGGAKENTSRE